jgi:endoglucanase
MKIKHFFIVLFWAVLKSSAASDLIDISPLTNQILVLHYKDGYAVYHQKGQRRSNEYVVLEPLNNDIADQKSTYTITSPDDEFYQTARHPIEIGRKSKGTEFTWICQSWNNGCINSQPDHVKEHWIYLFLPEKLKNNQRYNLDINQVAGKKNAWSFIFDETELISPSIHTNMLGYKPDAKQKFAYLYQWMGNKGGLDLSSYSGKRFYLINHFTKEVVFEGSIQFRKSKNNVETGQASETPYANFRGTDVYECDFSNLNKPGKYRLVVENMGCSEPFTIHENIYNEIFYTSIRGLYHNRSGIELTEPYTEFVRPAPHNPMITPGFSGKLKYTSSRFIDWNNGDHSNSDKPAIEAGIKGSIDSWGWYQDAGDWDGYYTHLNIPTILLFSWQIAPENYSDHQLNLPESNNGIPDILDEAAWLPRFFYRTRHELINKGYGSGGVGGRVCGDHFGNDGEGIPSYEDTKRIYIVSGEDPHSTYKYAAVAAQLAFCLQKLGVADNESVDWKKEAIESYQWAKNNTKNGDENTKPAMPDRLQDFRAFAAASLFQLTGDQQYINQLETDLANLSSSDFLRGEKRWAPFVVANYDNSLQVSSSLKSKCKQAILNTADAMVSSAERRACRWGGDFYFPMLIGQATTPMIFEIIMGYHLVKNDNPMKANNYLSVIHTTADYFLGTNPLRTTWITGLGINRPRRVFHIDSWYNGKDDMVPGITPYGPWRHETFFTGQGPWDVAWTYKTIYPANISDWPGHERWFDNYTCPLNAEFTVHQNTILNAAVYGFLSGPANPDFTPNRKPVINQFQILRTGNQINTDTLIFKVDASDPDGDETIYKVEFYNEWRKLGEDRSFPFQLKYIPEAGKTLKIKAKVIDEVGAFSYSETMETDIINTINNHEQKSIFDIYPNPFSDRITFAMNQNISGQLYLKIYNLNGSLIWQTQKVISGMSVNDLEWVPNNNKTSEGLYFYNLKFVNHDKTEEISGKIIYQN